MQILIARLNFDIAGNDSGSRKKSNAFKQFLLKRKRVILEAIQQQSVLFHIIIK